MRVDVNAPLDVEAEDVGLVTQVEEPVVKPRERGLVSAARASVAENKTAAIASARFIQPKHQRPRRTGRRRRVY